MRKPKDITELHIGMKIANTMTNEPMFIVGVFAASYPDLDNEKDVVYADFEDNVGDVFEYYVKDICILDE